MFSSVKMASNLKKLAIKYPRITLASYTIMTLDVVKTLTDTPINEPELNKLRYYGVGLATAPLAPLEVVGVLGGFGLIIPSLFVSFIRGNMIGINGSISVEMKQAYDSVMDIKDVDDQPV